MKRILSALLFLLLFSVGAMAGTGSSDQTPSLEPGWIQAPGHGSDVQGPTMTQARELRANVLLIETTQSALNEALDDLGVGYDYYFGDDFSALDLSGYAHVFIGMDGGSIGAPSIANAADFVNSGGKLHFYGGTCWFDFADAVNSDLVDNDTGNYCWTTVGGAPHSSIVDPSHYLAYGLPASYNFLNPSATYYQTRATDPGLAVAAVNGDGYDQLFAKAVGTGIFDWCINSAHEGYYTTYPTDYAWLRQVVWNMYFGQRERILLIETASSALAGAFSDLGVSYDYFFGDDFSALDLSPYEHVFVAMDGGLVEEPSIINAANYANAGGRLHFYGGTCYENFADAVYYFLVVIDNFSYCWEVVFTSPSTSVTNDLNYLAMGLPSSYDFADMSATYYQARVTDATTNVAAVNGNSENQLFGKVMGAGTFDWCINTPYVGYYSDPGDYAWLRQVVRNMLLMPLAPPAGVALYPSRDVTLYGEVPGSQANGAGQHFFTGTNGFNGRYRGLLHFDVAGALPPNAVVTNVTLRCFMSRTNPGAGVRDTQIYAVTQDWGEAGSDAPDQEGYGTAPLLGDATWNHTFYSSSFWANPGGDFNPGLHGNTNVDWLGYYFWSNPLMTADVQNWVDNPGTNFGWLMMGDESIGITAKRFDTKENGNPDFWPVLYVDYEIPGEYVLYPVKDVTLYGEVPGGQANGAGEYFFTGKNGVGAPYRALLQFDLSGIPTDAPILGATLTCYMSKTNVNAGPRWTTVHRALQDWGEGASDASGEEGAGAGPQPGDATWLHTFFDSYFWFNTGGDFDPTVSASQLVGDIGHYSWSDPQLTQDVQDWIQNPGSNFGWLLMGDEYAYPTSKRFNTKENPNPDTWPVLVIHYPVAVDEGQPGAVQLSLSAYPNPFNPKTTVSFSLAKAERVRLDVFDINGRAVRNLLDGPAAAGRHEIVWDGADSQGSPQASGVYLFRVQAGEQRQTLKAILLK